MKSGLFRAVILGAPASGKGTISSRIIKLFDIKHISSGDILRNHILNRTNIGSKAKTYIDKGQLVPDDIMVNLIADELKKNSDFNWLLDGFPRTDVQARELYKLEPVNSAINLVVPFEEIIHRVKGRWIHPSSGRIYNTEYSPPKVMGKDDVTGEDLIQRPDDQPEAVQKRLEVYSTTIVPVLNFYAEVGILKNFEGRTSNEIWPKVYKYLSKYMKPAAELKVTNL